MSGCSLVVLKLGSSVLRDESDLPRAADEIAGHVARGWRVLAVVSALGNGTERLIDRARPLLDARARQDASTGTGAPPSSTTSGAATPPRGASTPPGGLDEPEREGARAAFAALLATGEAASAALVGLALDARGIDFSILDVGRVGPFTRGPQLDAMPHALDTGSVKRALVERPVAILPGFVGRDSNGRHTLLGRGGSDLSALFAAHNLRAERCRLLKDVDGIYEHDPALRRSLGVPRRFAALDWDSALRLQDAILQHKAAQYAFRHRVVFEVGACGGGTGTVVGATESRLAAAEPHAACVDAPGVTSGRRSRRRAGAATCAALAVEGGLAS